MASEFWRKRTACALFSIVVLHHYVEQRKASVQEIRILGSSRTEILSTEVGLSFNYCCNECKSYIATSRQQTASASAIEHMVRDCHCSHFDRTSFI